MTCFKIIIAILAVIALFEFFLQKLVDRLREDFQWLITRKRDFLPELDPKGLDKFLADGFDSELGWVRKPNTEHNEIGRFGETVWHTNANGARLNPGHEDRPPLISCFGDSFTFCRQVNDNETWEYYLSGLTRTNVLNWGVGNHGIDQSLLRLMREYPKHPTEIVIVGVVPDTISRILSVWKHFYEYGNTFGFKPRFILGDDGLVLIKNPVDEEHKFYQIESFIEDLKKNDFFYENKFLKELISFPYIYSVLKNPGRSIPLLYWISMAVAGINPDKYQALGKQKIMDINLAWRLELYKKPEALDLLKRIILELEQYSREKGFKLLLALLPQKDDILRIKKHGHFYQPLLDQLKGRVLVADLAEDFLAIDNIDEYYSDDSDYGGHYSRIGNELVAKRVCNVLKDNNFIQ
jgi:hypothetical protein